MSKSILCASIVVLLGIVGAGNAQSIGFAQHQHPAIQQSYYVALHQHHQGHGPAHVQPCPPEKVLQIRCCSAAGKCQPGPRPCCAVQPCPKQVKSCAKQKEPCAQQVRQCQQKCSEAPQQCPESDVLCQTKVEQCSEARVEPLDCEFAAGMKRVEAIHELAREADKRGLGDVAHHLRVQAEEMEIAIHRQREQREQQEHLQRMHQEHAELGRAAQRQMQAAQELLRKSRHLAEQIKLIERQMHQSASRAKPKTHRPAAHHGSDKKRRSPQDLKTKLKRLHQEAGRVERQRQGHRR